MSTTYSGSFKEQALVKVYSRGQRTIQEIATELNLNFHTLRNWMKQTSMAKNKVTPKTNKRPNDWSAIDKLTALQESHHLSAEALNAWCREKGIFAHHLAQWKTEFCSQQIPHISTELQLLKTENSHLKRDMARKDKALAEAAALLILQKKFRALWEGEEK